MSGRDGPFEEWANASAARLVRTAVLMVGDRYSAEDLVQEVLERMYVAWPKVKDPDAYARRALVNASTSRWRYRARRPQVALDQLFERGHPDDTRRVDDREELVQALSELPVRQRAVVVLRFLDDQSEAQTAYLLGIRVGTVKSHTSRAMSRLRELLTGTQEQRCAR